MRAGLRPPPSRLVNTLRPTLIFAGWVPLSLKPMQTRTRPKPPYPLQLPPHPPPQRPLLLIRSLPLLFPQPFPLSTPPPPLQILLPPLPPSPGGAISNVPNFPIPEHTKKLIKKPPLSYAPISSRGYLSTSMPHSQKLSPSAPLLSSARKIVQVCTHSMQTISQIVSS